MTSEQAVPVSGQSHAASSRADARRAAAVTVLVILVFTASRLAILDLPSDREYDEGVYLLSARALLAGHRLFVDIFSAQPPALLETMAAAMRIAGDSLATARAVVLGFAVLALAAMADIARRLGGPWAAPAAAAALVLAGTFLDLAHLVLSELPAIAVALASLSACFQARARGWHRGWIAAAGALYGLSLLFKLFVAPLAVAIGLLLLLSPEPGPESPWTLDGPDLFRRAALRALLFACGALAVVSLPLFFYDTATMYAQVIGFQIRKNDVYAHQPLFNLARTQRHLVETPVIAVTSLIGAMILLRTNRLAFVWLVLWLAATTLVLVGQAPLFWRHFVLVSPIVALAAAALPALVGSRLSGWRALVATMAIVCAWSSAAMFGTQRATYPLLSAPEADPALESMHEVVNWIRGHTSANEIIATDDPMAVYLSGRQTPPGLCDTSMARIAAGSLTLARATALSVPARVVILRKHGRLTKIPGYHEWLTKHYVLEDSATAGPVDHTFWTRKSSGGDARSFSREKPQRDERDH